MVDQMKTSLSNSPRKEGNTAAAKSSRTAPTGVMPIARTVAVVSGNGRAQTIAAIYQDRDKPLVLCKA
jgi:hypothetical protein